MKITELYLIIAIAAALVLAYRYGLPGLILRPRRMRPAGNADHEAVTLTTHDGLALAGVYLPATGPARGNLIVLHGIGSAKEVYLAYADRFARGGFNVLLYDARAHGRSGGRHVTYGHREWEDVRRAVDFLAARNALTTAVFGHSMGGAVAVQALAREPRLVCGIVESAFTDLRSVFHAYARQRSGLSLPRAVTDAVLRRAGRTADFDPFTVRPVEAAARVTQPTLVVHGAADRRISADNARRLYAALGSRAKALYLVEGADHDDVAEVGGEAYWRRLTDFLVAHSG